jgi:hypothetical protein
MPLRPGAILLDALGTLLTFEPPAAHLRAELLARTGTDIGADAAEAAAREARSAPASQAGSESSSRRRQGYEFRQ